MKALRFFPILALFTLLSAGCDDTVSVESAGVVSREFMFDIDEADLDESGLVASAQYDVPAITRSVVDNGAVLAFFRQFNTWTAMPFTYGAESPDVPAVDYIMTLGYAFDDGFFEVFYESSSPQVSPLDQPSRRIKIVIIDQMPYSKKGIDLRNWDEVKAYYGLKD